MARKAKMAGGTYKDNASDEKLAFDVFVDTEGCFTAAVPKDASTEARDILESSGIIYLKAKSRDALLKLVEETIDAYFAQHVTISRVLAVIVEQRSTALSLLDKVQKIRPEEWQQTCGGIMPLNGQYAEISAFSNLKVQRLFKIERGGRVRYFRYRWTDYNFPKNVKAEGYGRFGWKSEEHARAKELEASGKGVIDSMYCVPSFESDIFNDYAFIVRHLEGISYLPDNSKLILEEYSQEAWETLKSLADRMLEVQIAIGKFLTPKQGLTLLQTFQSRQTPLSLTAKPEAE